MGYGYCRVHGLLKLHFNCIFRLTRNIRFQNKKTHWICVTQYNRKQALVIHTAIPMQVMQQVFFSAFQQRAFGSLLGSE
jgi:hypothetical protein